MKLRGSVLRPENIVSFEPEGTSRRFDKPPRLLFVLSVVFFVFFKHVREHGFQRQGLTPSQSGAPFAAPSHFPSDRKQGAVFLYKFRFTTGNRKSLLAKVSL